MRRIKAAAMARPMRRCIIRSVVQKFCVAVMADVGIGMSCKGSEFFGDWQRGNLIGVGFFDLWWDVCLGGII